MLALLVGCQGEVHDAVPPIPEVGVETIAPRMIHVTDEFNGRVEAVDAVELRPRVSGYLDRVVYKEGDSVAKGAVLFVIDRRPYLIALDRAKAQLQRARATAHLTQLQHTRVQTLIASRATSREELDNARAAYAQARADLNAAEAAVADAKLDLGFTEVRAPIAGRVGRAIVTAGNLARADQTLLTTIVAQDPVYVYFDCDEQSYLRYGRQRTEPRDRAIGANPVRIGLANEAGFSHVGTVDFLDNRLDPATGTIRARARLANPDHVLTPGLYARVQLTSGQIDRALTIDDKAVLTDQDRKYVYVIGPGDKALRRDVTIGREFGGRRIVESGLESGNRVVVEGLQRIFYPGASVKPKALAAQTADDSAAPATTH
ncbi:efflux RND transporter periplasmic adaptor subunit [Burkholderia sp. 22PA0106]